MSTLQLIGGGFATVLTPTGIFLMLAGALCLMLFMAPKPVKKEEKQ